MSRHELAMSRHALVRRISAAACLVAIGLPALGVAQSVMAQAPRQTVQWSVAARSTAAGRGVVVLELTGRIEDGWHVYALGEPPGGPTPLRLVLDANDVAQVAGPVSGSVPERKFDPSFGLETEFYSGSFTLRLPLRITGSSAVPPRRIPVSVRFQTCNGRECEPPRTVHLTAAIPGASGT